MALCGERLKYWKSGDHRQVILSTRWNSPEKQGVYIGADGATHVASSTVIPTMCYTPLGSEESFEDDFFKAEFADYENIDSLGNEGGASGDIWMVINVASSETDVTPSFEETACKEK